MVKLNASMSV